MLYYILIRLNQWIFYLTEYKGTLPVVPQTATANTKKCRFMLAIPEDWALHEGVHLGHQYSNNSFSAGSSHDEDAAHFLLGPLSSSSDRA